MKKPSYQCPYCSSKLNVDDKIILTAKRENGQKGLLLLSATLGNYNTWSNNNFNPEKGEKLELHCSVCQHDLIDNSHINLSKLIRIDENEEEHTLLFSNLVGEQCTLLKKGEHETTYGEQAIRFQDPEWYLQKE